MARTLTRFHIGLGLKLLTDAGRTETLTAITQLAPTSQIYIGSPAIQTSFTSLVKKGAVLKVNNDAVATDKQKLKSDTTAETAARTDFDGELLTLATLTETNAKAATDVTAMGFKLRGPAPPKLPPAPPDSIDVKLPKRGHGKLTVSAHETGTARRHYVAEWSPDPIGPNTWSPLVGTGKSRTVTGASGTHVWVRYATIRGQVQSEWGTATLVTIP
jgi:hypothetical protein